MNIDWRRYVAAPYGRRRVRRGLDGLHVFGLDNARQALALGPVTFAATHVAWWDGVLMVVLDDYLGCQARFLMDDANLRKLPFFKAIGAIGLDRSSPLAPRRALTTARNHLSGPNNAIWMFPQGKQRPRHVRPLGLHGGLQYLQRNSTAIVVPVTLGYGFRESHKPAAVVTFEPAMQVGFTQSMLEEKLLAGIDRADDFLDGKRDGFKTLIGQKIGQLQHSLGSRILARLTGG
ncbi:MAG: 1-acyl-sn-glycerol-3-phosphate acyltransferase [Myxococcota bacterium]|jgi:1-acyl-sn-glycerol-3-phosphate acyltransferase